MSDEASREPIAIHLELRPDGSFTVSGPLDNPILFLGMLEMAKQRVLVAQVQRERDAQAAQAKKAADRPLLFTPDGVRLRRGGRAQ